MSHNVNNTVVMRMTALLLLFSVMLKKRVVV
jgi:hypothetical protein